MVRCVSGHGDLGGMDPTEDERLDGVDDGAVKFCALEQGKFLGCF